MILWRTVFSAGDLTWIALLSVVSVILFISGFVRAFLTAQANDAEQSIWQSLPQQIAALTIGWALWIFTLSFAPSMGTVPETDPNPQPMLSLQKMMAVEDAKKDETHLYGRGGLLGGPLYLAMDRMWPVVGPDQPMFPTRRPHHHLPLLLEFCFRWSGFMIIVLPLLFLWSRSVTGIRLAVLTLLWSTAVYAPVVHAVSGDGWLEEYGAIDFSLGLPLLALACSAFLKVPDSGALTLPQPTSRDIAVGVLLIWSGLSLHVSGYSFSADGRAMIALTNMLLGTATGIMVWSFCNSFLWKLPFTANTHVGVFSGLAAISSGAGVMLPQSTMIMAACVVAAGNIVLHAALRGKPQDPQRQQAFSVGICSLLGLLCTGLFATSGVAGTRWDGREITGAIQGNPGQVMVQGVAVISVVAWSTIMTALLFRIVVRNRKPQGPSEMRGHS